LTPENGRRAESGAGWQSGLRAAGPYMGLGVQLAGSVLLYVVAGYLADRWLGTEPWLLVAGSMLGMATFFVLLARTVRRLNEETARRAEERRKRSDESIHS